jgi:hypothetical protein
MNYYKDSKIPVENFYAYISDGKHSHLLKKKKKLSNKNKATLELAFKDIFSEHCYLTGDSTLLNQFKKEIYLELLQGKINAIKSILTIYESSGDISVLELLPELGVPFNSKNEIEPQVKKALRKIKGLNNRYNIYFSKNNNKKVVSTEKEYNVNEQALNIELSLKLPYSIDISTCTLGKWDSMIKLIKNKKNG